MGNDTFYELTRRSISLTKNDGIFLSWRDTVINVRTDKGMNFFEFSYNLECLNKDIDLTEFSVPSPKNSPAAALCKSGFINHEMKNYDYTEMIIDSSFWPHNASLTQEMTNVSMSAWSPPYFCDSKRVLAILNNIGGVEIFMQQQYKWISILDLSQYVRECLEYNKSPKSFKELKTSVYIVESSSICWAPDLNRDHSCYLMTSQKNGALLLWQIFHDKKSPVMKGQIHSNMSEIKNMIWIRQPDNTFWLICGDVLGQVNAFHIQIGRDNISLLHSHILWQHKDRMVASHFHYITIDDNFVIFYSKHRHFVVQLLDENYKVLSQYLNNINDYRITDITSSNDSFYLATVDVNIFKLNISVAGNTINVDLAPVELKEHYPTHELHSLCFSNTGTLCALGMLDRKLLCRKETFKIEIVIISTEAKLNSVLNILLDNPKKKLTDYWDCIESLRYKVNKNKKMPTFDYNSLYIEASNDIYRLKFYLILLTIYSNMRRIARIGSDLTLPELSVEAVKEKLLYLHAQSTIDTLYKKHKKQGLNSFEDETFLGCLKYLEFYSIKHEVELVIDKKMSNVVKSYEKYICQSCDDVIEGFTCKSGHINMYCILSFTPIVNDNYLLCRCCSSTVRPEACMDDTLCIFCDLHLIRSE